MCSCEVINIISLQCKASATTELCTAFPYVLSDLFSKTILSGETSRLDLKLQMNICAGTKAADRGIRQANFYVLRGAFMPAVLVEMGFISNMVEESFLVNQQYQERIARTLFEGIKSFKFRYDRIRTS